MDKIKEIANDPAKLEAALKEIWTKFDTKKQGWLTHEEFRALSTEFHKASGQPEGKMPSDEERKKIKELIDPENTGKITFEQFVKLTKLGLEKGA